jgi:voltage-gated potassium channel
MAYDNEKKDSFLRGFKLPQQLRILLISVLILLIFGSIGYSLMENVSFLKGLGLTLETLAFYHIEPKNAFEKVFAITLLLFGGFLVWFVLWTMFDFLIEGQFDEYYGRLKLMKNVKKLKNHFIICGGGRVGEHLVESLKNKKEKYVIIEKGDAITNEMKDKGYVVMKGDVLDEQVLIDAGIKKAKAIVAALPETEKNILITLTARELNPNIIIYARSHNADLIHKLKKAGANHVVMPELVGAEEIMKKIEMDDNIKKP